MSLRPTVLCLAPSLTESLESFGTRYARDPQNDQFSFNVLQEKVGIPLQLGGYGLAYSMNHIPFDSILLPSGKKKVDLRNGTCQVYIPNVACISDVTFPVSAIHTFLKVAD